MLNQQPGSPPSALTGSVKVTIKDKAECLGDPQLEEFRCGEGPAAREVRLILENLLSGEAVPQTVAFLVEESSEALVGIASVRFDGNAQIRAKSTTPWFVRRLSSNPYVNMIARDERFRNRLLCDRRTRLGSAILRAGLEVLESESAGRPLPTVWALVRRENLASQRAFRDFAFYPHDRSHENEQDVFVRRAGRRLPDPPDPEAYRPLQPARAERQRSA